MRVTEIQRFCMHDGPGIRTTVFLKGCPLRCFWCHNPETQRPGQEILYYPSKCIGCRACESACPNAAHSFSPEGSHVFDRGKCVACGACVNACPAGALLNAMREMTPEEVLFEVMRDKAFYGADGGVTLSGGEPLLQGKEALALLRLCREAGIGTAVETCGFFDPALIPKLAPVTDLLLWDYKDADNDRLFRYTGAKDRCDVDNLIACDSLGIPSVLRCIMVNGVNIDSARLDGIVSLCSRLKNCRYVELLPYHPYGGSKQAALGAEVTSDNGLIPPADVLSGFAEELGKRGVGEVRVQSSEFRVKRRTV